MSYKTKILIVDDEPVIIASLLHYFTGKGFDVAATISSSLAVTSIAPHYFDVVITDYRMSPVDGLQLARHFRGADYKGKIVLISADCPLIESEMKDAGIDLFIEKPFDVSVICGQIKDWSGKRDLGVELPDIKNSGPKKNFGPYAQK